MRRFVIKGWWLCGGWWRGWEWIGGNGNGSRELSFTIRTSAHFAIHHVHWRAVIRRYHSDGHLIFIVVITFRVIVIIHGHVHITVSHSRFKLRTARCLSFCRLHWIRLNFLNAHRSALLGTYLYSRLWSRKRRGLRSDLRKMRDRGRFFDAVLDNFSISIEIIRSTF